MPGVGKYRCVTGGDCCFIMHSSDTAVALTALQASVNIAYRGGTRTLPIEQYFTGPNVDLMRENILQTGELLTSITLPPPISEQHSVYLKARERESGDFALVSVAAALTVADGTVTQASVALGGSLPRRAEPGLPKHICKTGASIQYPPRTPAPCPFPTPDPCPTTPTKSPWPTTS